ncbi:unnamed protein product, partial [Lymnaea stagnalis]
MTTSQAKPDIQQPTEDQGNGCPVEEHPIQTTTATTSQTLPEEKPIQSPLLTISPAMISLTGYEPDVFTTEETPTSDLGQEEQFQGQAEQEEMVSPYSMKQDDKEHYEETTYEFGQETIYHGKRALEVDFAGMTFSGAYEEREETFPEGYAIGGAEPQDEPVLQEGEEELELEEEEEEEFEERPEEELIRLEEPPAETDDDVEESREVNESTEEQATETARLTSSDLLCVSSHSDHDRPLSPTPDALRQGFFGGNFTPPQGGSFTPPQSGMFTPPISGSHTPPQAGQESMAEESVVLEKAATTFVDSILEDVKVKVSSQETTPEDLEGGETQGAIEMEQVEAIGKSVKIEQTTEELEDMSTEDNYGQPEMFSESAKKRGVTLVKQISEDIPGIILTQHLHQEMNEDEYYGYSPQPESISEDEEEKYIIEQRNIEQREEEKPETYFHEQDSEEYDGGDDDEESPERDFILPFNEQFSSDEQPETPTGQESEQRIIVDYDNDADQQKEDYFLGESDPGSGLIFTETLQQGHHDDDHFFVNVEPESGSGQMDDGFEGFEPYMSQDDHGDSSSVDSFATVMAAEADDYEEDELDENRLAEIASMTSSFTSDIQMTHPEERQKEMVEDLDDTEDDDVSMERSQEWTAVTAEEKDRESDTSVDSDRFEFVDRAALSIITEMSDEDKFEMIEREDLESEAGLSDQFGSSPDNNVQQSPGVSNLRFFSRGAERDDTSISSSLAEFEQMEKAIPFSSSLSSIDRDLDRDIIGGSYDERKFVGFSNKLKGGEDAGSIASSLAEFEHLEQVLVVSSSASSVEKHTPESKSSGGSGDNTSNSISSSLADFEKLEHDCQGDSDEKKSSVESSSRQSEASSYTSLNEFERLEREIAVATELEVEAQKIVSILESGVLMGSGHFGSSDFSEVGGGDERDERDSLDGGHDDVDLDSLSEGARLGHEGDADSLDGESSEITEMASSVVFAGPDLMTAQTIPIDLDNDSLQGEALMQLSSDSLILEQRLKTSDSAKFDTDSLKFDTDSLFEQDDRMIRSADSLELGGQSSEGQSS